MTEAQDRRRAVFGVGIGASALAENARDPALQRAIQEDLLEDLTVHGRLVFSSEAELGDFVAAVRALPSSLAKAWEAVLSSRRVMVSVREPETTPSLDEFIDPMRLESRTAPEIELVLLETEQAELLGVGDADFSARSPGGLVEIGRLSTASRTATVLAARTALREPMREGTSRELEWQQRLEPLVEASSLVVIYDKYVGMQTARRYLYDYNSGDGLTWLVTRIGNHPGKRLRIITATSQPDRRGRAYDEQVLAASFQLLHEATGRRVNLDPVFVADRETDPRGRVLHKFGHDRHVRFGERAALALGMGIQTFANANFPETITVARLPIADAKSREERAIRTAHRAPRGGWMSWRPSE
ncbi:MAG: hypothetical protein KDC39_06770 [Actinobacteria bacterium]|nr:hypothetical protein [Actinomycetota bacterium]